MHHDKMIAEIRSGPEGRERVISTLYHDVKLQNGIKKIMQLGQASIDDFNEIFNYTLVQFLKGVMEKPDFTIGTNVNSYLFGIARNLWLQELRKRKKLPDRLPDDYKAVDKSPTIDLLIMDDEKKALLTRVLGKLGKNCRKVLMLWAADFKMKEIADQLDYSSAEVVRKKKFNCMKELNKFLTDHPSTKKMLRE